MQDERLVNGADAHGRKPLRALVQGRNILLFFKEVKGMEHMQDIITAISTVGFPIVFCLLLFWYLRQETESHKTEMNDLKNVISENNSILASLKQLIEDKLKNG